MNYFKMKTLQALFFCGLTLFTSPIIAQQKSGLTDTIVSGQPGIDAPTGNDTLQNKLINTSRVAKFGEQGMGMSTRIRGTALLNINANPLIVVNGIPYQNIAASGFDFTTADERDYAALIGIPQNDIEEIAIAQDATSVSQFGSRAANGVILITTKRGLKGRPVFNYRYEGSVRNQPVGYEMLNGNQYNMLMLEAFHNTYGTYNVPEELAYDPSSSLFYLYAQNTDWLKEITQTGQTHDHYFSISGGFKKFDYRVSTGYLTQDGLTIGTGQKRFNTRVTLNYAISDRWKVSAEMGYTHASTDANFQREGTMPIQELALKKMPNMSIYQRDASGNATSDYYVPLDNFQGDGYTWYNPVATANLAGDNTKLNLITPTFTTSYRLFKNLNYNFYVSYSSSVDKRNISDPNLMNDPFAWDFDRSTLTDTKFDVVQTQNQFIFTPYLNNKHSLMVTALFNTLGQTEHFDITNTENTTISTQSYPSNKFKNYFSTLRARYQYEDKYVIDISGREEGSSMTDYKYKFYPATTVQWLLGKESFMKSLAFISDFTFHASYAEFGPVIGYDFLNYSNDKTLQKDLGVNVSVLKSKLNLNFILYNRKNTDQTVSSITSTNRGWELSLNYTIIKNRSFSADFSIDLYRNRSLVNTASQTEDPAGGEYVRKVEANKPMGSIYGYQFKGVNIDDQDAIAKDKNGNSIYDGNGVPVYTKYNSSYTFQGGDAKYADRNFDGIINASDIVYLGDANPYFTGSGGPSFHYKGWWLGIYFNFRLNNKIMNMARMSLEDMNSKSNQSIAVLNRWRAPGMVADLPRACLGNPVNSLGSDRFVEDGSFLRLKAITLKYQLPETFLKKLHLKSLEFYAIGSNLWTYTQYTGADPEIGLYGQGSNIGADHNFVPRFKEFTFGINVGI